MDSISLLEGRIINLQADHRRELKMKLDSIIRQYNESDIKSKIDSITHLYQVEKSKSFLFDEYDRDILRDMGLSNPEEDLKKSLLRWYNFQQDAILGGTMEVEMMQPVGPELFLALGADGHISLWYVFRYEIKENKTIKWKLIYKGG
ncbi:hypothetical protein D0T84_10685 [Dysgonomonas sp. 521]|nr:hypothetical protein [Dysgonomonas sp. 521]